MLMLLRLSIPLAILFLVYRFVMNKGEGESAWNDRHG